MGAAIDGGTINIQIDKDKTRVPGGGGDSEADGATEDAVRVREKRMTAFQARPSSYGAPIVLVVDDGETNRALVMAYLADLDCRLRSAESGPSALAAI